MCKKVQQHFVIFYSPGTFVAESTEQPILTWDVGIAMKLARKVKERHGATPYGFQFTTRTRGPKDLDSRVSKKSGIYYLGGIVETLADLEKRNDQKEEILRSNMRFNGWEKIITNNNSWKWTQPLNKDDTVLEFKP